MPFHTYYASVSFVEEVCNAGDAGGGGKKALGSARIRYMICVGEEGLFIDIGRSREGRCLRRGLNEMRIS